MIVYHNTTDRIQLLDPDKTSNGLIFFSTSKKVAEIYGSEYLVTAKVEMKHPFVFDAGGQVWANIELMGLEGNDEIAKQGDDLASDWCGDEMNVPLYATDDIAGYAKHSGKYDGVIIKDVIEGIGGSQQMITDYIVWDPKQIKILKVEKIKEGK